MIDVVGRVMEQFHEATSQANASSRHPTLTPCLSVHRAAALRVCRAAPTTPQVEEAARRSRWGAGHGEAVWDSGAGTVLETLDGALVPCGVAHAGRFPARRDRHRARGCFVHPAARGPLRLRRAERVLDQLPRLRPRRLRRVRRLERAVGWLRAHLAPREHRRSAAAPRCRPDERDDSPRDLRVERAAHPSFDLGRGTVAHHVPVRPRAIPVTSLRVPAVALPRHGGPRGDRGHRKRGCERDRARCSTANISGSCPSSSWTTTTPCTDALSTACPSREPSTTSSRSWTTTTRTRCWSRSATHRERSCAGSPTPPISPGSRCACSAPRPPGCTGCPGSATSATSTSKTCCAGNPFASTSNPCVASSPVVGCSSRAAADGSVRRSPARLRRSIPPGWCCSTTTRPTCTTRSRGSGRRQNSRWWTSATVTSSRPCSSVPGRRSCSTRPPTSTCHSSKTSPAKQ